MKLLKFFFVFVMIVACKKDRQELVEPACLLSETEMINLMIDVSLVKSAKSLGRKGLKDSGIKPLDYLFIKHGVDTITIRENIEYYNADLKKSESLYNKITDTLRMRKEVLGAYVDSLSSIKEKKEEAELLKEKEIDSLSGSDEKKEKNKLSKEENDSDDKSEEDGLLKEEEMDSLSSSDSNKNNEKLSEKEIDSKDKNKENKLSEKVESKDKNQEDTLSDKGEGVDKDD